MIRVDTTELDTAAAALHDTARTLAGEGDGLAATRWQAPACGDARLATAIDTFASAWTVGLGAVVEDLRRAAAALSAAALGYDLAERAAEGAFVSPPTVPQVPPEPVTH